MTPWDHFGKSLSLSVKIFLVLATLITQPYPTEATSYCSNSFRFDQLCPDPRYGPRAAGTGNSHQSDITINLVSTNNRKMNGGSVLIKDPSTISCDFHRNGMETVVVKGVHITEHPWKFPHANACTNIVKLSHDMVGVVGSQLQAGQTSVINHAYGYNKNEKICSNVIGIRWAGRGSDKVAVTHEMADDLARKTNVDFWHNFTLYSHSVQFEDTITNYHMSNDDLSCVDSTTGQYAQIVIDVSRSGRGEIIVQQYKIEMKRSPWGCNGYSIPNPIQFQFCGSYQYSQINSILTGLKLLSRPGSPPKWNDHDGGSSWDGQKSGLSSSAQHGESATPNYSDSDENYANQPENQKKPLVKEVTTASPDGDEALDKESKPMDWREFAFLSAFPMCGVFFILIVLNILRSQSAREICMVYTYPRPDERFQSTPCNPIDINKGLPM